MIRATLVFTLVGSLAVLSAQGPPPTAPPSFEVASVKPNDSGSGSSSTRALPNGQYTATNATLRSLIVRAYGLRDFQVTGGPSWVASSRFDVVAKLPEGASQNQAGDMLRTLLIERFALKTRIETREQPIYALVMARPDRAPGPGLKMTKLICEGPNRPVGQNACGLNTSVNNRTGRMTGGYQSADDIARAIANFAASRMVVNRTGLDGRFDYELRWTIDNAPAAPVGAPSGDEPPSLFTAIQEQLGLKVESDRGAVEFLVIESVSQPTPD